jgi:hypothetical protein
MIDSQRGSKMKTWGLDCNGPDKHSCVGCSHCQNEICVEINPDA